MLPLIVDAVMLCAKQQIALRGREVLSVCLRLLDFADPTNPIQREVLLDLCDLPRTTGSVIAATHRDYNVDFAEAPAQNEGN